MSNLPIFFRIADAYCYAPFWRLFVRQAVHGGWRAMRPEAMIFGFRQLVKDWTVVDRLGEIRVPTLVMAGREDFVFPPACQQELVAGIPHAHLKLIDHAGHNPQDEQTVEVVQAVRQFMSSDTQAA